MTRLASLLFGLIAAWPVHAAPFGDPTRPPGAKAGDEQEATAGGAGARLESVLISPDRRIAVIGGQQFRVGDKFGEGRIVGISETEVVIRGPESSETLKLFPDVQKVQRAKRDNRTPR
jgi:MSHA biogenesis protein MshK